MTYSIEGLSAAEIETKFAINMSPIREICNFPKIRAISIPAFQCRTRQINSRVGQNIGARKALPIIIVLCRS